ncbi:hypothetical protein TKK_0007196 [Trichogramma kaykai]
MGPKTHEIKLSTGSFSIRFQETPKKFWSKSMIRSWGGLLVSDGKTIGGKGRFTGAVIDILSKYYDKAVSDSFTMLYRLLGNTKYPVTESLSMISTPLVKIHGANGKKPKQTAL